MNRESVLLTDLYQLTMLQAYYERGMNEVAVFEFFVRKLPEKRNFLIAAGLEQVLEYLEQACFAADELQWLQHCGRFRGDFVDSLADWCFTGDVDALPEGTLVFPDEPLLRIIAPMREAQLVETRIINLLQFQSMVAAKAARCVLAAAGRTLVDFGLRRAHGAEAGLLSARASYLAGFTGTATVLAGMRWGIPLFGTMAHSYIQANASETQAFENFARSQPGGTTLLIDTYDTEEAARKLVALMPKLAVPSIQAVRLDSGDLGEHARRVRAILDAGGLSDVRIFASGNLDEYRIRDLLQSGAPIDGFGVGTRMNTSADQPYLDCAYKLQEYAGSPRRKRSEGKATWPGRKQVRRAYGADGRMIGDLLTVASDSHEQDDLLIPAMRHGRRVKQSPALADIRARVCDGLARLPAPLRSLDPAQAYPVTVSQALHSLALAADRSASRQS
ncbi:MAG: nicotinate phosphoribosyltransferase [Candidatus Accumulibacter phosphatis]|uniref:Nicotinate phosphoribosyltransferase n=1 Tax=Candidatus Accumulibacter cognatus TaxID=2954383 RepID=A0A080MAI1_9PROT|nr:MULTISPECIES: nicotinate phosphoribosyltransferase [Candidatus Accumulibacter]MCQ1547443.1 nicotinate phosphoribosyltransferase [Candidatus Accumulibacter phosphatis]KFB78253.1 MAG: Nicotinate phosphoribosyltransferase pncB2 [Candidatus Accumulibacter cognatus]MBN8516594.1 nicotinate phosphoribosyltransferase [Accumulibacter sp.]MBO3710227.1 nicotinate phosphoribosyltransferase [Accumulibacter sp.]MCM8581183.1 nicotinate phosphoribosyltransferase [Accumulibacter sp.]